MPKWVPPGSDVPIAFDCPLVDEVERYVPPIDLQHATDLALELGRPLLVLGEYGTPKSLFAANLASRLGVRWYRFEAREHSVGSDLTYRFDEATYLRDLQSRPASERREAEAYILRGVLWHAYEGGDRPVVLIEGLERASVAFILEMLTLIDTGRFVVTELQKVIAGLQGRHPVFVLAHELGTGVFPDDRLARRCITYTMAPASTPELELVVRRNVPSATPAHIGEIVRLFVELRHASQNVRLRIPPTVADLLDWTRVLLRRHPTEESIVAVLSRIQISPRGLDRVPIELPCWQVLFHDPRDIEMLYAGRHSTE